MCIICHQVIRYSEKGRSAIQCPNGNVMHQDPCLKQWFITGKHPTCPFCREPFIDSIQEYFEQLMQEIAENEQDGTTQITPEEGEATAEVVANLQAREELLARVQDLIEQSKLDAATNVLFDYQDKNPNDPEISYLLGMVFFIQQKFGLSVNHLMKAVKIEYKFPMAFYYLAKSFLELEMPEKAIWAAERALVNFGRKIPNRVIFAKIWQLKNFRRPNCHLFL